jgi:hypothetical protein
MKAKLRAVGLNELLGVVPHLSRRLQQISVRALGAISVGMIIAFVCFAHFTVNTVLAKYSVRLPFFIINSRFPQAMM